MSSVVDPSDQLKLFPDGGVTSRSILPFASPQSTGVMVSTTSKLIACSSTRYIADEEQFVASDTVTVYVPAGIFTRSSEVAPLDHRKV